MSDLDAINPTPSVPQIVTRSAPVVFIHASPRTSSTWFWAKFRELPSTLCFCEPFNFCLNWLTHETIAQLHPGAWESRHPPIDPYYREYAPLLRDPGGVQFFDPAMTLQWFIPQGGLRGALRPSETDYLRGLIHHAGQAGKIPVFGDCWSLGRLAAMKQALGGFHIFQYRNLWRQWLSYLSFKRQGDMTFYVTTPDIIVRDDDPFFAYLVQRGLSYPGTDTLGRPDLLWTRPYVNVVRDEAKVRQLELLAEHHGFALFMGLHIYLYLHARSCADLSADATRMARDPGYRADIERAVRQHTGLTASFADAADVERPGGLDVDTGAIDWNEIREHARVAVEMLSAFADPEQLTANATALIDDAMREMRRDEASGAALAAERTAPQHAQPAGQPQTDSAAPSIGLCMIVKNEAPVIRRCLDSVRPIIGHWVIVDTGSTDGTQDIIREHLRGLPGELHERPWRDFAHNRSEALELARGKAGYTLIIDADDTLEIEAGTAPPALSADSYTVEIADSATLYRRIQLVRSALPWHYEGVLHEFVTCDGAGPSGHLSGIRMRRNHDGARRKDPQTYRRDVAVLEAALQTETRPFLIARYRFYLAQSYRDCGEAAKALQNYLLRAELGFWQQEVFVSLYYAAKMKEQLGHPEQEVINAYLRAADALPTRAEALHGASRFCRCKGRNEEGCRIAKRGLEIPLPADALFVEPWIYETGLLDEFAVNAYWCGQYRDCLDASLKILATGKLSGPDMQRAVANARFATEKLPTPAPPNLGTLGAESLIDQHKLVPQRALRSRVNGSPRVLVAILAKQKEWALPLYLECIEALDYPKSSIVLYIRTNNNTDRTEQILREWVERVGHLYAEVEFDASDVSDRVEQFAPHEWNATRFRVLGRIRNTSLRRALEHECDFYFVADVDNFIRPCTLRELVALDLPIAAPLLRSIAPGEFYSNYHAEIDANGYYKDCDQYQWILHRWVRGVVEMPLVHCTYLIRADGIPQLAYQDASGRHEYVVFSDRAREAGIPQYLDNRQVYGYITFGEGDSHHVADGIERGRALLDADFAAKLDAHELGTTCSGRRLANPDVASRVDSEPGVREKFSEIYRKNEWGYGSGVGSLPINNIRYMEFVQSFIADGAIKSVVDFGCGDWQFSRFVNWNGAEYVGFDLVPDVIENNRRAFARPGISFEVFRDLDQVPAADLLLCKDVFQHVPNDTIREYLETFKRKCKFLLITNDDQPDTLVNSDIQPGGWRPVRLDRPPFSEPAPIILSWTVTWGGWKPTHKATSLVNGVRDADYARSVQGTRARRADRSGQVGGGKELELPSRSDLAMLEPIHLINLDRSTDRLAKFKERNSHLKNILRISAVDGTVVDREKLVRDGTIAKDLAYLPGALGCALSHVNLWKQAVSESRGVTIFEDDVICSHNFLEESARVVSSLPADWDIIQWGYIVDPTFLWLDFGFSKANLRFYDRRFSRDYQKFQCEGFSPAAVRLVHSYGTQAYSVSPKGAHALLECCVPLTGRLVPFPGTGIVAANTGIDCAMCGAYGSMQAFICIPPLVIHDDEQTSDRAATDRKPGKGLLSLASAGVPRMSANTKLPDRAGATMVHWCRKVMNDETMAFVSTLPTDSMDALEISGEAWGRWRRWKSYQAVHYPEFDLNYDTVPNRTFDIIFAEQVLEHVRYPYRSVKNIFRMLRPSGLFIVTTPFLIQIHLGKMDYTRWTPEGLKYLLEECGFNIQKISVGSWGNRECAIADLNWCAEGKGWHVYDEATHSLENEPDYPVVVWAFAQKDESPTLYSGDFFDRQSAGSLASARIILEQAFRLFQPTSIVDVGCGVGPWLCAASEFGIRHFLGIDGDYVPREKLMFPLERFRACNLEAGRLTEVATHERFDLVICLEVAEHLSQARAASFVDELCALGDAVLFSAAIPGQGGTRHLNERWPGHWSAHFARNGFACFDHLRSHLWTETGAEFWYVQNILFFARRGTGAFEALQSAEPPTPWPRALIHPRSKRAVAAASPNELPFTVLIPVCDETLALEFSSFYLSKLGIEPLYVLDRKASEKTRRIVEKCGTRFTSYDNDKPFIENGYESFAAQSPADWLLRLDCDEVPNLALLRLGEAFVREQRDTVIGFERDQLLLKDDGLLYRAINDRFSPHKHMQPRLFNRRRVTFDKRIHTPGIQCDHLFVAPGVGRMYHFSWIFLSPAERLAKSGRYDEFGQPSWNRENQCFSLDNVESAPLEDEFLAQAFAEWVSLLGESDRESLTRA